MNTKGKQKAAPKEIRVISNAAPRSLYIIDARKLLQPWITVSGEGPRLLPPIIPRALERPLTLRAADQADRDEKPEHRTDIIFDLLFVAFHPVRWYRHFKTLRPPVKQEKTLPVAILAPVRPHTLTTWPRVTWPRMPKTTWGPTHRAAVSFGVMSFLLLLPLHSLSSLSVFNSKEKLEQQVAELQKALKDGATPATLTPSLFQLVTTFHEMEQQLGFGKSVVQLAAALPVSLGGLQSDAALFEAGQAVASAVTMLHETLATIPENATTAEKATALLTTAESLKHDLLRIQTSLLRINPDDVPEEVRPHVLPLQKLITAVNQDMDTITHTTRALLALLGGDAPARYLVLFQNDAELRATGGFIGSFGILDVDGGSIKKFEIPATGSYAVQGQLTAYLRAPEPLHAVNTRFEFQDSNWFPDFPASAQTAMRLYELSHGATVDGVIALDTHVIQGLLAVLGPLENPSDGTTLDTKNIVAAIQKDIQKNKEAGQAPKQMLGTLAPVIMKRLEHLAPQEALELVSLFNTLRNQKDILVYAKDPEVEHELHELAWDGAIPQENMQDYLLVVNSNIGGGKTDALIDQKILQRITIAPDGGITKQLTIVRTHTGDSTSTVNRDYLRVYVPEGATLISASGFNQPEETTFHAPEIWYDEHPLIHAAEETATYDAKSGVKIYQEFGKTVFANWVLTEPGETSIIELTYQLPHSVLDPHPAALSYLVHAAKQPGDHGSELLTSIILPEGWEPVWLANRAMELGTGVVIHHTMLKEDQIIGLVLSRK